MSETSISPQPPTSDPSLTGETDPAAIDAQIATGIAEQGVAIFLNNFRDNLPGGLIRQQTEALNLLDGPCVNTDQDRESGQFSERLIGSTWRSFLADVDQAITHTDSVDVMELQKLKDAFNQAAPDSKAERYEAYMTYLLPVYRSLRIMGYAHADLRR